MVRAAAGAGAIGSGGACTEVSLSWMAGGCLPGQCHSWLRKRPPIAKEATATDAVAKMTRERDMEGDDSGLNPAPALPTRVSACKNSSADGKRCAGSFSRDRRMALFSAGGKLGSTSMGGAGGLSMWPAMMVKALRPSNGLLPVASSYSTTPSE